MKHKAIMVIALLALVSLMVMPVSAETLTQTVGEVSTLSSQNYYAASGLGETATFSNMRIVNIEYTTGASALVHTDDQVPCTFDAGAPLSARTSFSMSISDIIIATGEFGYQRLFTPLEVETNGYQWMTFDTYDVLDFSGDQIVTITMDHKNVYNITSERKSNVDFTGDIDPSIMYFDYYDPGAGYRKQGGYYTFNRDDTFFNTYSVTYPSGLGITGSVNKNYLGQNYSSRAYIVNASGAILANENTANTNLWNFTLLYQPISIRIQDTFLNWYNSSILFAAPTPTVTPTPTTTIPPGYIVTYVRTFDPLTNSDIHGTNINLYDVENASWTNYTADADGRGEIYTLPYHTINAYANYPTAGVYNDAELLGAETGYSGGKLFYLDMYPYTPAPAEGYIELYITTRNRDDKSPVTWASIGITTISTGAYYGTNSGTTGTDVSIFPNDTALKIIVSKSGYQTATVYADTGDSEKKYVTIDMDRATATPTVTATPFPGEETPRPTQDPNDPALHGGDTSLKAQEMMNWLAMNGMMLVQLCFLVTIFALLGVKFGR